MLTLRPVSKAKLSICGCIFTCNMLSNYDTMTLLTSVGSVLHMLEDQMEKHVTLNMFWLHKKGGNQVTFIMENTKHV